MKKIVKTNLLMVLCFLCLTPGCKERNNEDPSYLTTDCTLLTFENGGGSLKFLIESNTSWTIVSSEEWINVTPNQGEGNQEIMVSVADMVNPISQEGTIIIRTNDGTKIINLKILLKGGIPNYPSNENKVLALTNTVNFLHFSGVAQDEDSLVISSNIAWEIKGPEWIETWDGERWRPLSLKSAVIYGFGSQHILLRTAEKYDENNMREGLITISEHLTGYYPINVDVRQTGKYIVVMNKGIALANGIGMNWKCGNGVKVFYYNVSEKPFDIYQVSREEIIKSWKKAIPGSGCGWDGLKENTLYYITTISEESLNSNDLYLAYTLSASTRSSSNQPFVKIDEIVLSDNVWYAYANKNEQTLFYLLVGGDDSQEWTTYNDPLLAYFLWNQMQHFPDNFPSWSSSGYVPFMDHKSSYKKILAVSWAMGSDAHMSAILDRKWKSVTGSPSFSRLIEPKASLKDCITKEELESETIYINYLK